MNRTGNSTARKDFEGLAKSQYSMDNTGRAISILDGVASVGSECRYGTTGNWQ